MIPNSPVVTYSITYWLARTSSSTSIIESAAVLTQAVFSLVTCDRFYRRTESLLQFHPVLADNCVHILGVKSNLFKVWVSRVRQSCLLASSWCSWICIKAKTKVWLSRYRRMASPADCRHTSSLQAFCLTGIWYCGCDTVCFIHLCTSNYQTRTVESKHQLPAFLLLWCTFSFKSSSGSLVPVTPQIYEGY